ncbi:MAG: DNA primase [Spirochaetales bacterium]|jgi:DNA primase|nr:DNA primase [Spirochaetales bacterium]
MRIPENVIQQISEKVDMLSIIGGYTNLTQKGANFWGLCPFHSEKTPSFSVRPDKGIYYCFGCHKGGSIFNFLMEAEKLSFTEAVEQLGRQVGVEIAREAGDSGEVQLQRNALSELFRRVAGSFHYLFTQSDSGKGAYAYLTGRGITRETIDTFQIGYAPADPFWLEGFLKKHGYSEEFLASSGLLTSGKNSRRRAFFTHRVIFPIFSAKGDIIAFGGRILEGDGPKYLNSSDSAVFKKGNTLYGFFQAKEAMRKERSAVIVEGYMDVIALHQAGVKTAVAPLGTAFTPDQARMVRRFADTAILFFDGDAAGQKATKRCAEICESLEFEVYAAALPEDKDPADFVSEKRLEELQKILKYPIHILEYLLEKCASGGRTSAERVVQELFPYIRSIVSAVRRDAALTKLSDVFGIEKSALVTDFQRAKVGPPKKEQEGTEKKEQAPAMTPELLLIIASIDSKDDFSYVRSRLSLDDFTQAESRDVFISLEDNYRSENWNTIALLETIENTALKEFIIQKLASDEFAKDRKEIRKKIIKDAIEGIQKRNYRRMQKEVERELRSLDFGSKENEAKIASLLERKMYLDGELEKLRKIGNE